MIRDPVQKCKFKDAGMARAFPNYPNPATLVEEMQRNQVTRGIVLSIHRIGEIHKGVTLLTSTMGLVNAIAHGAWKAKSKLRAATQLFTNSELFLYYDPVRKSHKISDMRVISIFEGLSARMEKYLYACACAEIVIRGHGGGESREEIYLLLLNSLKSLNESKDEETDYVFLQFLIRFLTLAGYMPDESLCAGCGKNVPEDAPAFFHPGHPAFFCRDCQPQNSRGVNPGMRKYIGKTRTLDWRQAVTIRMERASAAGLKEILINIIESLIESPLKSIYLVMDKNP
jgi:DNA repair protein RecO (recombination protein O)